MSEKILEIREISKSFPGVQALDRVSFDLYEGEIHVLMGENGAGKSTLMKIINGLYKQDKGEMLLLGRPYTVHSPKEAQQNRISMIHQELNTVPDMSIAENIYLGREPHKGLFLDKKVMNLQAKDLLAQLGLNINPAMPMRSLSVAQMQMVEIAKAIFFNAKVIIMDEPTSAISDKEVDVLFDIIAMLRQNKVGIIYISHKMDEVFRIADRITVLRDGKSVTTRASGELDRDTLISLMVGREFKNVYPPAGDRIIGDEIFRVENLSVENAFSDVGFTLREGEILGVAGLMGSGRSEVLEAIFGLRKISLGNIFVKDEIRRIRSPYDAIAAGIAFVTEDRKLTGLNLKASVKEEISIVTLGDYCTLKQFISAYRENKAVDQAVTQLNIKTPSRNQLISNLSGGNQQKVILARWLLSQPQIFILDEPTRGIDVGAKYEIYTIINELAANGKAVLMVSSELPEIIGVCDRVIVMHEGRLSGELSGAEMSQESIMRLAAGHKIS